LRRQLPVCIYTSRVDPSQETPALKFPPIFLFQVGRVSREAMIVLSLCYFRYEPTLFFISFRKITSLCGKACMVPDRLGGYGC